MSAALFASNDTHNNNIHFLVTGDGNFQWRRFLLNSGGRHGERGTQSARLKSSQNVKSPTET